MKTFGPLVRVRRALALKSYIVHIEFEDDTTRDIDLDSYFRGPVFEAIRNSPALFAKVMVEGGTIAWPNVLYCDLEPARLTEPEPA